MERKGSLKKKGKGSTAGSRCSLGMKKEREGKRAGGGRGGEE